MGHGNTGTKRGQISTNTTLRFKPLPSINILLFLFIDYQYKFLLISCFINSQKYLINYKELLSTIKIPEMSHIFPENVSKQARISQHIYGSNSFTHSVPRNRYMRKLYIWFIIFEYCIYKSVLVTVNKI